MPSRPMSSSRPMKGEMKVAPALAASRAWFALKHKVTLTMVPSLVSARQAFSPSHVIGTLMVTFLAIFARWRPSASMPSTSMATTSADTGPSTILQISAIVSLKSPPALATSDGLVVTPSSRPMPASSRMSLRSAVSAKNFIGFHFLRMGFAIGGEPITAPGSGQCPTAVD